MDMDLQFYIYMNLIYFSKKINIQIKRIILIYSKVK